MKQQKIRIVLIETSHPGNIGAVARAMKNMCIEDLYLVKPQDYPSGVATARGGQAQEDAPSPGRVGEPAASRRDFSEGGIAAA